MQGSGAGGSGDKGAMGKGGSRNRGQQGWGQACAWHMLVAQWCSRACPMPAPTCCALPTEDIRPSARSRTLFPRSAAWVLPPCPALRLLPAVTQRPMPPPWAPLPTPGMCRPPAASTATSMSTPTPPSHAPCQLCTPHRPWAAAAGGGCPKPASSKNSVQLQFCFKEKTVSEFLTDFYIPRTPDPPPPTRTRAR